MDKAKIIKEFRKECGLAQKEVANDDGVHPSNYYKKEKGDRAFGIEVSDNPAKFFGINIDELAHPKN